VFSVILLSVTVPFINTNIALQIFIVMLTELMFQLVDAFYHVLNIITRVLGLPVFSGLCGGISVIV